MCFGLAFTGPPGGRIWLDIIDRLAPDDGGVEPGDSEEGNGQQQRGRQPIAQAQWRTILHRKTSWSTIIAATLGEDAAEVFSRHIMVQTAGEG